MKKITYLLFSGLTLLAVACDKKLDIEPQQSISENIALMAAIFSVMLNWPVLTVKSVG